MTKHTTEKDLNALLDLILTQARRVSQSDAGSLYIVETDEHGTGRLRFKLSQNDSRPDIPFVEFTIPIDHSSLAGTPPPRERPWSSTTCTCYHRTWNTPSTARSTSATAIAPGACW